MRPQQQNRRMRGRNNNNNNNNRKGPNPLTRTYESNGPDVKIRGSAQQVADKYTTLARDAMSSGDRVMAENYLQHAEHYNRIIAAAQAQMPIQHVQPARDDFDEDFDEERDETEAPAAGGDQPVVNNGAGPQPVIEGTPAEVALNSDMPSREGNGGYRQHRNRDRRGNGHQAGRPAAGEQQRQDAPQETAPAAPVAEQAAAPVEAAATPAEAAAQPAPEAEEAPRPRRGRRPRRQVAEEGGAEGQQDTPLATAEG